MLFPVSYSEPIKNSRLKQNRLVLSGLASWLLFGGKASTPLSPVKMSFLLTFPFLKYIPRVEREQCLPC